MTIRDRSELTDLMGENLAQYVHDRIFPEDTTEAKKQESELERIFVHNGFSYEEVSAEIQKYSPKAFSFKPKEAAEFHFYDPTTKTHHMINTKDPVRYKRDMDLAFALQTLYPTRDISVESYHRNNSLYDAISYFEECAKDTVTELFNRLDLSRIKTQGRLPILMGPLQARHPQLRGVSLTHKYEDPKKYLDFEILEIDGTIAVGLDYLFAVQASNIQHELFKRASDTIPEIIIKEYHYGKYGAMNKDGQKDISRGDIIIPEGYLNQTAIMAGRGVKIPIQNRLLYPDMRRIFEELVGGECKVGYTLTTVPVLQEQGKDLREAQEKGAVYLDMEIQHLENSISSKEGIYPIEVEFNAAGSVSDLPLEKGKNLGSITKPNENHMRGQERIYKAFIEIIRRNL